MFPVDFALVRYSPVEQTHFFYDPAFPTAIQFLLNGQWEPWDVSWVRYKALDPEIRRIAEDAEARLISDPASGYRYWPSAPPQTALSAIGYGSSQSPGEDASWPSPGYGDSLASASPHLSPTQPLSPHLTGAQSGPVPYTSPYQSRPAPPPTSSATQVAHPTSAPPLEILSPTAHNIVQQYPYVPPQVDQPPLPVQSLPLAANRETKILLSLDGDGIRGLSAVLLVESLINAICVKIGRQVEPFEIFDLIGGTSTGGLVAIMLGRLRMQAVRAREAYKNLSKVMFMDKRDFFISMDPHVRPPQYDTQAFDNGIKEIIAGEGSNPEELFFDSRADSTNVFVVATQIDIGTNKPALIRSYQTRRMAGPELDDNFATWQVMRATAVAPRWVQPGDGTNRRPVIGAGLVDHGTAKNNPIRDILYECRKLYSYANDMMVLVSIGTGTGYDREQEINEMANSVDDRTNEARVASEKFEADNQALMDRGWMKYFRFNVPELDHVPLEEWNQEALIKAKTRAYLERPDVGERFYACVDAITAILVGERTV
ncbi:acyl transferase/acyl hydrolase/lysophospholipase [Massariosphaeria phaeospora]|uniref:Acyl transferase/acyl hydrolase/lysophospholipase n=1 Tax=Massariosphaeria phaeospora TaxID=100035 RepID=A0A7C8MJ25_9PLEO|nr:acyl transferase/acyl hydrolase/lysophospholipase [Massariosphaeria phaeospora]